MTIDIKRIGWDLDMLIPVPLSLARLAERGYNQAALIAFPIAIGLRIPYDTRSLIKVRDTRPQVGLSYEQRKLNLSDAFSVNATKVNGKRVLVVDDVTTSGSTLNECAKVLIEIGAKEVYGYTFARAAHNRLAANTEEPPVLKS
jgi:ComF family protein